MNFDSGTGQLFHPFHPGIHIHITPESVSTSLRNDYSHAPDSAQWGKSTVAAAMAVHRAQLKPGCLVVVLSPSARQSGELLRKSAEFMRELAIKPKGDGDNESSLLFPSGSRIVALPGKENTVRGFSAVSLMLIDEAPRVSDDLYKSVRPMLAVGGGDLWLMSTPYGKRGFFYEAWANGGHQWERATATGEECSRIPASFLEEEKVVMGDRWYRQVYCCEFDDADDCVFDRDQVESAYTDEIKPLPIWRR